MTDLKVGDYVRIVEIGERDSFDDRKHLYIGRVGRIVSKPYPISSSYIGVTIKLMNDIDGGIDPYFYQVKVEPIDILEAYAYEFNR
jgi:hypothetical protein